MKHFEPLPRLLSPCIWIGGCGNTYSWKTSGKKRTFWIRTFWFDIGTNKKEKEQPSMDGTTIIFVGRKRVWLTMSPISLTKRASCVSWREQICVVLEDRGHWKGKISTHLKISRADIRVVGVHKRSQLHEDPTLSKRKHRWKHHTNRLPGPVHQAGECEPLGGGRAAGKMSDYRTLCKGPKPPWCKAGETWNPSIIIRCHAMLSLKSFQTVDSQTTTQISKERSVATELGP